MAKGKKSEAGKAASAKNATRHGLSGKSFVVLPTENSALFHEQRRRFESAFQPRDAYEHELVSQIVEASWLVDRTQEMERTALRLEIQRQRLDHEQRNAPYEECLLSWLAMEALTLRNPAFANLLRYRAHHERSIIRCQKALSAYRKDRGDMPLPDFELPLHNSDTLYVEAENHPKIEEYETKPPGTHPIRETTPGEQT